jgi:hypothetical protein
LGLGVHYFQTHPYQYVLQPESTAVIGFLSDISQVFGSCVPQIFMHRHDGSFRHSLEYNYNKYIYIYTHNLDHDSFPTGNSIMSLLLFDVMCSMFLNPSESIEYHVPQIDG